MLGSIDALLTSVIADSLTRTQHNSDKELIGQGLGNRASGLVVANILTMTWEISIGHRHRPRDHVQDAPAGAGAQEPLLPTASANGRPHRSL